MQRTRVNQRGRATTPASEGRPVGPGVGWAAALFFAVSLVYFLPSFLPGRHIFGTDYLAGGYFFYHFISERLADGELPKWVPHVFGGLPLFANPGSTFYPVHLLADLVLPASKIFPVVLWFQFGIAGLGMYLLARELEVRPWIAVVAGIAFQFTGITMSWVYAGHDGRIIVATFAPLFFYFLHRGVRTAAPPPFVGAAATLGFALLSFQIQNSYYLLLAAAAWAVFCLVRFRAGRTPSATARVVALGLGAVAFGFVMATVNFLPFLDYIPESPRGGSEGRGYEYSTSYSMPEAEILSLAVPEAAGVSVSDPQTGRPLFPAYSGENGFKLHTEYVGAFVLVLLALGTYYSRRDRTWWFLLGLGVVFLTIALGGNTPLYRLYYEILPGTKRFRAPSLSYFVVAMSLVTMAALTLERLSRLRDGERDGSGRLELIPWIAGAVVALALIGAAGAGGGGGGDPTAPGAAEGWGRFALFAAAVGGVVWAWTSRRMTPATAAVVLSIVTLADLWVIDRRFFHTVAPPDEMFAPDDVISFLESQPAPNRAWMFPLPQPYGGGGAYGGDYPMLYDVHQVGGEHPNPLRRWVEYVGAGTETYIDWHNLITRASVVETPEGQAISFETSPGFLDAANVRYVVSLAPLSHPALREVHRGGALVYENTRSLPRAYLVPEVREVAEDGALEEMLRPGWDPRRVAYVTAAAGMDLPGGPSAGEARVTEYEPDRVVIRTRSPAPALLVLADNQYEGWRAEVDGREERIVRANHTFRGVYVPAGEHTVVFRFEPGALTIGFYVYLAALAMLVVYAGVLLLRRRSSGGALAKE